MKRIAGILCVGGALALGGCGGDAPPPASDARAIPDPAGAQTTSNAQPLHAETAGQAAPAGAPLMAAALPGSSGRSLSANLPASVGQMDEVVAQVNGEKLTMRQLVAPLIDSHGLTMLLNLVQLELAKQDAALVRPPIIVTQKDFDEERQITLNRLFKDAPTEKSLQDQLEIAIATHHDADAKKIQAEIDDERDQLLDQFLENQHIGRGEFELVLRINTYVRKIAEPQMRGKINDAALRNAFGQMYGERVVVRYMELANMDEVNAAKRRLAAGDAFADVAHDMSHNARSAALGGELPPFSRQAKGLPDDFKAAAFSLKDGQVSDVVTVGNTFILIKRERVLAPKAVKFEDVKESIRATLTEKLLETAVKKLREDLATQALAEMKIEDPVLAQQFKARQDRQIRDQQRIKLEMDKRQRLIDSMRNGAATRPASPTTRPAPLGPESHGAARPATRPALPTTLPAGHPSPGAIDLPKLIPDSSGGSDGAPARGK